MHTHFIHKGSSATNLDTNQAGNLNLPRQPGGPLGSRTPTARMSLARVRLLLPESLDQTCDDLEERSQVARLVVLGSYKDHRGIYSVKALFCVGSPPYGFGWVCVTGDPNSPK